VEARLPNILILSAYDVGGASIAAIRQHVAFLEAGLNSRLLTLHKSSHQIPQHDQFSPEPGWGNRLSLKFRQRKVHKQLIGLQLPPGKTLSGEFSMPIAAYDVTSSQHWAWADVVVLHWVNEWISIEMLAEKAGKKPLIWVMHDMHAFSGGCHYNHGCEGLIHECAQCPLLAGSNKPELAFYFLRKKKKSLEKHPLNLAITAPSQWMVDWSKRSALFKNLPHQAIFNGVNVRIFKPLEKKSCRQVLGLPIEKHILLCVVQSLDDARKGFGHLLQMLHALPQPENWVICTVGHLKSGHDPLPVEHIHLGSLVDERLMAMVYNAATIFVHPAIEDNLPNVVVEALACGIPVAGFRIGGMPEMVMEGKNGYLATTIHGDSLAEAVMHTANAKFSAREIADDAEQRFSLATHARNFLAFINTRLSPDVQLRQGS